MIHISIELYLFLLIELLAVAWLDFKYQKIANLWGYLNIAVFFMMIFFFKENIYFSFSLFLYPVIFFLVGFLFYLLRIMGGGDSKYLVTFFLIVPKSFHEDFLFSLLMVTIIVGGSQFIYNSVKGRQYIIDFFTYKQVSYLRKCYGKKFPFAPLILLSWIIFGMNNLENIK